ncbi:MAG: DUF4091 domain-containing protein [Lentisphaeria bacterium]|jgi:hypothetical protein|nr:DUF4091 domain-containing protein [Lentisphaeria bacterium]
MHDWRLVAAAAAWMGLCGLVSGAPPVPEIATRHSVIRNGGFEEGDELPVFWDRHPREPRNRNAHRRDTTVSRSGQASGKLVWLDPIEGPNQAWLQWMKYGLPVEGGSSLLVSGYVRTETGVPGSRVGIHLYDRDGAHLGFRLVAEFGPTPDWQVFDRELPLPPEAAKMGIALYSRQGGATWYDDIAVIGTPAAEAGQATPTVDGRLDEACYAPELAIADFVVHTGDRMPTETTRAWLAHDAENLYVAFACPIPVGRELKLAAAERDSQTWLDESIEVFLDPGHTHADYVQFCINADGVVRDSRGRDPAWNCPVRAATRREPDRWLIELAIPFAGLDLPLSAGPTWGINLVRNDRCHGETVTWSLGGFHQPGRFGNVRFQANFAPFLGPALVEATRTEQGELDRLRGELRASGLPNAALEQAETALAQTERNLAELNRQVAGGLADNTQLAAAQQRLADGRRQRATIRNQAAWQALESPPGLPFAAAIVSSCRKVLPQDELADLPLRARIQLTAAQDETESCQLAVRAGDKPVRVELDAPPLDGPGGKLEIRWHPVGWVVTGQPKGYNPRAVGRWPDVLFPPAPLDVPAGETRTFWLGVDVPPDAAPGTYRGTVRIVCGKASVPVPVELRVRPFRLPRPGSLSCPFGIYASALSGWYFGTAKYAQHITPEQYAVWCEFLGRYRLSPKNVANEYLETAPDGTVQADALATTLKPYVDSLYPPSSYCMYRLPCPRNWQDGTTTDDPEIQMQRLQAKRTAFQGLGLPASAYIYGIDEPSPSGYPFVRSVYERARQVAPGFPVMQTVNHTIPKELVGTVDIWCPLSARYDDGTDFYRERQAAGDQLWLYVCCGPKPPYANFFVDQEGAAHRVLFWQTWQARATGLLYWCVIWWHGMPGPQAETHFPDRMPDFAKDIKTYSQYGVNGDGVLLWPGPDLTPWPSLRLEIVRDGIEDYEYLALLKRCIAAAQIRQDIPGEWLEQANALLEVPPAISRTMRDYTLADEPIQARREQLGDLLERLVQRLGAEPPVR